LPYFPWPKPGTNPNGTTIKGKDMPTLTEKRIERATKKPGRYRDGLVKGLYLKVADGGSKSWVLRYEIRGRERFMGLGSLDDFSLKEARERARAARQLLADGIDPLADRQAKQAAAKLAEARKVIFRKAAERYFDQHESKWTSAGHRDAFLRTLTRYAAPIMDMDVNEISIADVLRCLEPRWTELAVTLDRVRGRIENVLDSCKARKERDGDNPAAWAVIGEVLPAAREAAPVEHHKAMPYVQLPAFMVELRALDGVAPRALEFLILCAARSGEVREAEWGEISFDEKMWVIPARRMKARREHRVTLSDRAIALLKALPREPGNPRIFLGHRANSVMSRMSLTHIMRKLGQRDATTIHGFRSAFSDWAHERTAHSNHTIEIALAHSVGTETERAYRRGDMVAKRHKLANEWAKYCASPPVTTEDTVVSIRRESAP
jgi:integrase